MEKSVRNIWNASEALIVYRKINTEIERKYAAAELKPEIDKLAEERTKVLFEAICEYLVAKYGRDRSFESNRISEFKRPKKKIRKKFRREDGVKSQAVKFTLSLCGISPMRHIDLYYKFTQRGEYNYEFTLAVINNQIERYISCRPNIAKITEQLKGKIKAAILETLRYDIRTLEEKCKAAFKSGIMIFNVGDIVMTYDNAFGVQYYAVREVKGNMAVIENVFCKGESLELPIYVLLRKCPEHGRFLRVLK